MSPSAQRASGTIGLVVALLLPGAQPAGAVPTQPSPTGRGVVPSQADVVRAAAGQGPLRAELDGWAARLTSADPVAREGAVQAIALASPRLLPAVVARLDELAHSANREAMGSVLRALRSTSGLRARATDRREPDVDPLTSLMRSPHPAEPGWREATLAVALCRMLSRMGTVAANRELIAVYQRLGDAIRAPVEREIKLLGERAVAALIETRRGDDKSLRPWAARLLDAMGKTVPGEAVQTSDNQVLADVLRAYGRTKDGDAARVVVSFANSDRAVVREAAREAVAALGDGALWQLREAYENATGKKPSDGLGWPRLAEDLFATYDRSRRLAAATLMEQGVAAERAGDLKGMAASYDGALARAPEFERAREMVPGYLAYARAIAPRDRAGALLVLRRIAHLDPGGPNMAEVSSLIAYHEAEELAARGVVDRSVYQRAAELDVSNTTARNALARIDIRARQGSSQLRYAVAALLIALSAIGAATATRFGRPARAR